MMSLQYTRMSSRLLCRTAYHRQSLATCFELRPESSRCVTSAAQRSAATVTAASDTQLYSITPYSRQRCDFRGLRHNRTFCSDDQRVNDKALYDGKCPLCMAEIEFLRRRSAKVGGLDFVDISRPDYDPAQHGNLDYDIAMKEMHVIAKDGKVYRGVAAMERMWGAVGLGWVWGFAQFPGFRPVVEASYSWFALNRLWLTGRSAECESGHCEMKKKLK